jgi:hypothetical protein
MIHFFIQSTIHAYHGYRHCALNQPVKPNQSNQSIQSIQLVAVPWALAASVFGPKTSSTRR